MAINTAQYATLKLTIRAILSGNPYGPSPNVSETTLFSFINTLFTNSAGAAALTAAQTTALTNVLRAQLTSGVFGAPSTPSAATLASFLAQLSSDSSGAAALPALQYSAMFGFLRAALSDTAAYTQGLPEIALSGYCNGTAYLGQVATRCEIPDSIAGTAGHTFMERTAHVACDNITSLQLVDINWYVPPGGAETAGGGTMAITAGIEYPAATFTQVKYSGIAAGSAPAGTTIVSDPCAVVIPQGATFFVRRFINSPSGTPYCTNGGLKVPALGDASAVDGSDLTLSGTVIDGGGSMFWPAAIIAKTTKVSVAVIGESRCSGNADVGVTTGDGARGEVCRALAAKPYAFTNFGISAESAVLFIASHTLRVSLMQYHSVIINQHGINDMVNGGSLTALQHEANQKIIQGYFPANTPYYVVTVVPFTTSSDSWATLANQTVTAREATRITWNNRVRQNLGGFTGGIELADYTESSRDSGKWAVNGTANWLTADGLHENSFANNRYVITLP